MDAHPKFLKKAKASPSQGKRISQSRLRKGCGSRLGKPRSWSDSIPQRSAGHPFLSYKLHLSHRETHLEYIQPGFYTVTRSKEASFLNEERNPEIIMSTWILVGSSSAICCSGAVVVRRAVGLVPGGNRFHA